MTGVIAVIHLEDFFELFDLFYLVGVEFLGVLVGLVGAGEA